MGNGREQFFKYCKRCQRQILMTYSPFTGRWIPCDPEIKRFNRGNGPETFVTPDGEILHGVRALNGEFGYRKHRRDCV